MSEPVTSGESWMLADVHPSHGEVMQIQGTLVGCTTCWRVVGFRCGDVTFAGVNECRPNLEITALARYYWERAQAADSEGLEIERIVTEFRVALRGASGGRHASGS